MLLAQQSASLLEAQTVNLRDALAEHEGRQNKKFEHLDGKIDQASAQTAKLEGELREAIERIQALEGRGSVPGGDHRRTSLVFGGWNENTRRSIILHQLEQSLAHLKVKHLFDSDPFTTGPRRAVALCHFTARPSETPPELRRRMLEIVQEVNGASLDLQGGKRSL